MIFDPVSYMRYKDEWYLNGTEVELKEEYIATHTYNGKKLWKYYRFNSIENYTDRGRCYLFFQCKYSYCDLLSMGYNSVEERNEIFKNRAPYVAIPCHELNKAIKEIIKPIRPSPTSTETVDTYFKNIVEHPKTDWDYPEMIILWSLYIVVMVGSLIFKQFYIIWAIATFLFLSLRKGIVK